MCSDALQEQVSESTWKTFFSGVRPLAFTGDRLVLAVPSLLVKERLENRYLSLLEDTLAGVAGGGVAVELQVHTESRDAFGGDEEDAREPAATTATAAAAAAAPTP